MVRAAMTELQLERLRAHRQAENLVAQADAERRHVALDQLARVVDRVVEHGRIARAIAEEHAVGLRREQRGRRCLRRIHAHVAAVRREPAQDVPLHAEVVGGDAQPARRLSLAGKQELVVLAARTKSNGASHVTPFTRSAPSICGNAARALDERVRVRPAGRDDAAHDARRPQQLA